MVTRPEFILKFLSFNMRMMKKVIYWYQWRFWCNPVDCATHVDEILLQNPSCFLRLMTHFSFIMLTATKCSSCRANCKVGTLWPWSIDAAHVTRELWRHLNSLTDWYCAIMEQVPEAVTVVSLARCICVSFSTPRLGMWRQCAAVIKYIQSKYVEEGETQAVNWL